MPTITSADGTTIAFSRTGNGPALILVDGAMCFRAAGPLQPLAAALQDHFTVYTYDRRGRGESSDTQPYSVAREVEDLRALVAEAGGEAFVYGISSGAVLALAAAGPGIAALALYEPPFMGEFEDGVGLKEYSRQLNELLAAGRRGDAVALFMSNVGIPAEVIAGIRSGPGWSTLESIAPTLAYDDEVLGDGRVPQGLDITIPTLVLAGSASPAPLQQAARAAADTLPGAGFRMLDGQTHDVSAEALAPVLVEFFGTNS